MQPIYVKMRDNSGKKSTSCGRGTRTTEVDINMLSALGSLGDIGVRAQHERAGKQEWASAFISVPADCKVEWDAECRTLSISRGNSHA